MAITSIRRYIIFTGLISSVGVLTAFFKINVLRINETQTAFGPVYTTLQHIISPLEAPVAIVPSSPTARLREACRRVDMGDSAYTNWPNGSYLVTTNFNLMICPLKGVQTQFWRDFFKVLKKEGKKNGNNKELYGEILAYSDVNVTKFRLVVQSINPYTWLLNGFVERSFLGVDICKEAYLQRFVDKIISGVKLRHNQGLVYTPMIPLCRPCDANIYSVVRYENFEPDISSLLQSLELEDIKIQLFEDDPSSKISREITDLTLQAARHFKSHHCSNFTDLGLRLLEAFKFKGYIIPPELQQYMLKLKTIRAPELKGTVSKLARGAALASSDVQNHVLHEAYASVTREAIQYIQSIYKFEFDAFAYNHVL